MSVFPIFPQMESVNGELRVRDHDWLRQNDAEKSVGITPDNYAYPPKPKIDVGRHGIFPNGDDMSARIADALLVAAEEGATLQFSAGRYVTEEPFIPETYVNCEGIGKYGTIIDLAIPNGGDNIMVDLRGSGTGGFPVDRKIVSFRHMSFDGVNAGNQKKGLALGWNMRSSQLLFGVRIMNIPDWGIGFLDWNWNIGFYDVEMDSCGKIVTNSTGWYKDPAVDGGVWNDIIIVGGYTEACGSSSSTAGGMNLQTTTANRSLKFFGHQLENNRGTDQAYITNIAALYMAGTYIEMPNQTEAVTGIELAGCTGIIDGGFIASAGANNDQGLQIKAGSHISARGIFFGTAWNVANIDVQGSTLENRGCIQSSTAPASIIADSTGQVYGDICPRVSAHKNGTNQTAVVTATPTKVTFGTELFDEVGSFASSTYTPKTKRKQRITAAVKFTAMADQARMILMLYANGSSYKSVEFHASGTGAHTLCHSWLVDNPATSTTWEIYVQQDSGSDKIISGATDETYFMAECA